MIALHSRSGAICCSCCLAMHSGRLEGVRRARLSNLRQEPPPLAALQHPEESACAKHAAT